MGKFIKGLLIFVLGSILIAVTAFLLFVAMPVHDTADALGIEAGETAGEWVGTVIGTFNGITTTAREGYEEGMNAGLSAEDTEVSVDEQKSLGNGKLEVLSADISVHDVTTIGDDYAVLYVRPGKIVFSVDLNETVVDTDPSGKITVYAPLPKPELFLEDDKSIKEAEYLKNKSSGSAGKGMEANIAARAKLIEESIEELDHYDKLKAAAKSYAEEQIKLIAGPKAEVSFSED